MLNTLLFLSTCIAMAWIIYWMIKNDDRGMTGRTTGLFAMREPEGTAERKEAKR
jgi:hypothetical protein